MTSERPGNLEISVVVPVYSGAGYLAALHKKLREVRDGWEAEGAPMGLVEAIFVDDAAIDESPDILDHISKEDGWVRVIHLSRNFGQHPATVAGILHSSGDWVVTLDEDLQHRPEQIVDLLREVAKSGCDVVYANAETPVHEKPFRDWGSRLYKGLVAKLTGTAIVPYFSSFRLIRGSVARAAASVCGHETYFDIALSWYTQRVGVVRMTLKDNRVIKGSRSGYSLGKLLGHARRMVISSRTKALRGGALIGLVALLGTATYGVYLVVKELLYPGATGVRGWTSLITVTVFFGGVITFLIGVLFEYVMVIVLHSQGKPTFFAVDRRGDHVLANYFSERCE